IRVADERITLLLGREIFLGAQPVHPLIAEGDEHVVLTGCEAPLDLLECNDWQIVKGVPRQVLAIDGEGAHLVIAVALEKPVSNIRATARAEEDDLAHFERSVSVSPISWTACLRTSRSSHWCTLMPVLAAALRASSFASGVTPSSTPK